MSLTQVGGAVARKLKGEMQTSFTESAVDYTVGLQVTDPFLGYVYESEEYFADPQQVPFETKYFPDELASHKWKKQKKWATKQAVERVKGQVNNLHTKREAIEWRSGLRVTDELQLYVKDGIEYLPDSDGVPFTTGSSFDSGKWILSELVSSKSKILSESTTTGRMLSERFADVLNVKDNGIDNAQDKCGWEDSDALKEAKELNEDNRTVNERNFGNRTVKAWRKAEGIKDAAVAMSFSLASEDEPSTQVANYNSVAHMAQYDNRDAVGLFGQAIAQPANCTTALTVFTLTTVTSNDFVGKDIKAGMTVEVFTPVRYVSIVEDFVNNVITVSAWYEVGKTNVTGKPTDGNTLYVNRFTKIWGQNTNAIIPSGAGANSATGFELGMACEKTGSGALSKGYDLITLWGEPVGIGYSARGNYIDTFVSDANCVNAYRSKKGAQTSFRSEDASVYHYVALVDNMRKFTVGANGSVYKHMLNGQVVAGNGTLSIDKSINIIVGSSSGRSISLPSAELNAIMTIKNNTNGSIVISGKTFTQYESKTFWSDGSAWNQIS